MDVTSNACSFAGDVTVPAGAVAYVHTHPFTLNEYVAVPGCALGYYDGLASTTDRQQASAIGLPGYIIDADQIRRFTGTSAPANEPVKARCGY
jgi:hypothetical protein